jgi:hypothetical protein
MASAAIATQSATELRLADLAHAVLAGAPTCDEYPLYTVEEWNDAAQCALDGDHSDLAHMAWRQGCYDRFKVWQRGGRSLFEIKTRENTDFDEWLESQARWEPLSDEAFMSLVRGQRRWARECGR